ncbi:MAG: trypsin-like serine peptidase [Longimicrobiales bacterium]
MDTFEAGTSPAIPATHTHDAQKHHDDKKHERSRLFRNAEEMARAEPIRASAPMPERVRELLAGHDDLYVRSDAEPRITVDTERLAASNLWRVSVNADGRSLLKGLPGDVQIEQECVENAPRALRSMVMEPFRPPWVDQEYLTRLIPWRETTFEPARNGIGNKYLEPITRREDPLLKTEEALRFIYPWRTIGRVFCGTGSNFSNWSMSGTGVLVGRNLMITAGHIAPWGAAPGDWWIYFIPGFRDGQAPHGFSFVERFQGWRPGSNPEPNGQDHIICKLYTPLGDALGYMGVRSYGSEDEYFSRRYLSVGYPRSFFDSNRPAVEFDIDIDDIDWDGDGLELEINHGPPFGQGWSGGPLWIWENESAYVIGIRSGHEKDEFDPRRGVFAGGNLLVERIRFGRTNYV